MPAGEILSAATALHGALRAVWDALGPARDALELVDISGSLHDQLRDRRFAGQVAKQARQALEGAGTLDAAAAARLLGSEVFVAFVADPNDPARRDALSNHVKQGDGLKGLIGPNVDEQAAFDELAKAFIASALAAAAPAQRLIAAKLDVAEDTALHVLTTALDLHPKLDHANAQLAEVLRGLRVEIKDLLVGEGEPFLAQDVNLDAFQMASDVTGGLVPPYVPRDIDPRLDELIADAASDGPRFVVVAGRTKSGKTRCLLEALARVTPLHLVYRVRRSKQPDTISSLVNALADEPPGQPWVILVDDLYQHLAGGAGADLTPAVRRAARIEPPGLIVATIAAESVTIDKAQRLADGVNDDDLQLIAAQRVNLPPATTPTEQARAASALSAQLAEGGIDPGDLAHFPERLAAIPELLDRIDHARNQLPSSSSRYALIIAATRVALAQASRAVGRDEVRANAKCIHRHLEAHERLALALSDHALDQAEAWAAERVGAAYALLVPAHGADDTVEVLDAALSHIGHEAIDPRFEPCGPTTPTAAAQLGATAVTQFNDLAVATYWTSQAANIGHPDAMYNLGVLLQQQGDLAGAEGWWRRAADTGRPDAMYNLGLLLQQQGDLADAEGWYRRAIGTGHASAMYNLALLLQQQGDLADAGHWYRRAADTGRPDAMYNLGLLLQQQGDLAGAEGWYRRAADTGHASAMYNLGLLLQQQGDLAGAEDWYRRAAASGDTRVAASAVEGLTRLGPPPDGGVPELDPPQ